MPLQDGNIADLQLSIDARHGPEPAGVHLLDLVALYLSPEKPEQLPESQRNTTWPAPKMSYMNSPLSLWRPPMLKSDRPKDDEAAIQQPALMHSGFERRAAEFPDRIAVEWMAEENGPIEKITYAELNARAEIVADELTLIEREIAWTPAFRNQRAVPIFAGSSPDLYVGIFGIMKAGFAFSPLPLDAPPQRLLDVLDDSKASVVLGVGDVPFPGVDLSEDNEVNRALKEKTWFNIRNITGWRASRPEVNADPSTIQRHPPTEDDLAYILYTSGSTGKPKGVLISHLSGTCGVNGHAEVFDMPTGTQLRWLQFGMPTFDLCLLELTLTLGYGGTVCVAERQIMLGDIERTINTFKATSLFTVASLATLLRPSKLPTLTTIISGGEYLNKYAIENFAYDRPCPAGETPKRVINIYGPTETTMCLTAETAGLGSRGSIVGNIFSCASGVIIDSNSDELKEVPVGLTGEIAFGGPMVGYGYLNRPEETEKAFTNGLGMGELYRTGDKGRIVWGPDGTAKLEILGRLNMEQVKLNSRRVELGEIESTIARVEDIREISTVVLDGSFLAAYMSLTGDHTDAAYTENVIAQCRTMAEQHLPDWMRPGEYTVLPVIPRTPNGKVNRKALQQTALEQFGASSMRKEPTPTVSIHELTVDLADADSVRSLAMETLKSVIGEHVADNDVTLPLNSWGLDSLRAMKFLSTLRAHDVYGLAMKDVLGGKTLEDVVKSVVDTHAKEVAEAAATTSTDEEEVVQFQDEEEFFSFPLGAKLKHFTAHCRSTCVEALGVSNEDIEQVLPATGTQTRMLAVLEELDELKCTKAWIEHFPYQVPESIDADRLEKAVIAAMETRDAFRTVWVPVEHPLASFAGVVLSKNSSHATLPIVRTTVPVYDTRLNSLWMRTIDNAQKAASEFFGLYNLGSVTTFVRSADNKHCTIIFSMSHLTYDGMSIENWRRDVAQIYAGKPAPEYPNGGVRTPVEEHFSSDWLSTKLFWMKRMAGQPRFYTGQEVLPCGDAEFISHNTGVGVASEQLVCAFSLDELFTLCNTQGLFTPMSVIQGAWAMALCHTLVKTNNDMAKDLDVQFGSIFHGRHTPDSLQVYALMLDVLPTRIVFDGAKRLTHREICSRLFAQYTECLGFSEIPCPSTLLAKSTRCFDSTLILQAFPKESPTGSEDPDAMPGFNREENLLKPWRELNTGTPLLMELWPGKELSSERLRLRCSYSQSWIGYEFMTPQWIQGLTVAFNESLIQILTNPDGEFSPAKLLVQPADAMDLTEKLWHG